MSQLLCKFDSSSYLLKEPSLRKSQVEAIRKAVLSDTTRLCEVPSIITADADLNRIKFLVQLLELYGTMEEVTGLKRELVDSAVGLFANTEFFTDIFGFLKSAPEQIVRSERSKRQLNTIYLQEVLKLISRGIEFAIPSSSKLVLDWFTKVVVPTKGFKDFYGVERALLFTITLQFFDLHQDLNDPELSYSYMKDDNALSTINRAISALPKSPELQVIWGLVLLKIAREYKQASTPAYRDTLKALGLREFDQLSFAAQELVSSGLTETGLELIVASYEALPHRESFAAAYLDMLEGIMPICSLTKPLARACFIFSQGSPDLARDFFSLEAVAQSFQIACAKLPATLDEVLLVAQVNPFAYRELSFVDSLVCFMPKHDCPQYGEDGLTVTSESNLAAVQDAIFGCRIDRALIPSGVKGKCLGRMEQGDYIIWTHRMDAWSLIGKFIESKFVSREWSIAQTEALRLIGSTLRNIPADKIEVFMGQLSAYLEFTDFLGVLERILSQALRDQISIDIMIAALDILNSLCQSSLSRVCSIICTSGLLTRNDTVGHALAIISSLNTNESRLAFTESWLKLSYTLVQTLSVVDMDQSRILFQVLENFTDIIEKVAVSSKAEGAASANVARLALDILKAAISNPQSESIKLYVTSSFLSSNSQRMIDSLLSHVVHVDQESEKQLGIADDVLELFSAFMHASQNNDCAPAISSMGLSQRLHDSSQHLIKLFTACACLRSTILLVINELISQNDKQHLFLASHLGPDAVSGFFSAQIELLDSRLCPDQQIILISGSVCRAVASDQERLLSLILSKPSKNSSSKEAESSGSGSHSGLIFSLQSEILSENSDHGSRVVASLLTSSLLIASFQPTAVDQVLGPLERLACRSVMNFTEQSELDSETFSVHAACTQAIALLIKLLLWSAREDSAPSSKNLKGLIGPQQLLTLSRSLLASPESVLRPADLYDAGRVRERESRELAAQISLFTALNSGQPTNAGDAKPMLLASPGSLAQVSIHDEWLRFCSVIALHGGPEYRDPLMQICELCLSTTQLAVYENVSRLKNRLDFVFFTLRQLSLKSPLEPSAELLRTTFDLLLSAVKPDQSISTLLGDYLILQQLLHVVDLELSLCSSSWDIQEHRHIFFSLLTFMVSTGMSLITEITSQSVEKAGHILSEYISITRSLLSCVDTESPEISSACSAIISSGGDRKLLRLYTGASLENALESKLADLSLGLLNEWLSVRAIAEVVAGNGLMVALVEAPISVIIQGGGILASTSSGLHLIWRRSLLGLVLKVLQQLGARVAPEAILFIENFRNQFSTCHDQWVSSSGLICQELIEETLSLTILLLLLRSLSPQDSDRLVFWNGTEILRAIDHLSSHTKYLSTRLLPPTDEYHDADAKQNNLNSIITELSDLHAAVKQLSLSQKA